MNVSHFVARLSLETEAGAALSDTRIRLLEEIDRLGSINRAAKAVPLSYKAAWDALDIMNNLSPEPLVERISGGRQGGGTRLTDYGRRIVSMYRALGIEYQAMLDRLAAQIDTGKGDLHSFQRLVRRIDFRTSARNQFSGPVIGLRLDSVDYEVCIRIDEDTEIVAIITPASAENLNLAIGAEVTALVKSSSVILTTDRHIKLSARNRLWGKVSAIHQGPVNNEVTLQLPSGRSVTSVLTAQSCTRLNLTEGAEACALFQASSVILAA